MTPEQIADANAVLSELVRLEREFEALFAAADRSKLDRPDIPALQERLKALKLELKAAAKYETISGRRESTSLFERSFYGPAVRKASAHFMMPTNANPFTRNWAGELYSSKADISYYRYALEEYLKENTDPR